MRLWSLHPRYLDVRGLVALWREALLAQAVIGGKTRGYTRHPQLVRFRETPAPLQSIAFYLHAVQAEATQRGYRFDASKIGPCGKVPVIEVTSGQVRHEWEHLSAKLRVRDPVWLEQFNFNPLPEPHSLFRIVPGPVAGWEVIRSGGMN